MTLESKTKLSKIAELFYQEPQILLINVTSQSLPTKIQLDLNPLDVEETKIYLELNPKIKNLNNWINNRRNAINKKLIFSGTKGLWLIPGSKILKVKEQIQKANEELETLKEQALADYDEIVNEYKEAIEKICTKIERKNFDKELFKKAQEDKIFPKEKIKTVSLRLNIIRTIPGVTEIMENDIKIKCIAQEYSEAISEIIKAKEKEFTNQVISNLIKNSEKIIKESLEKLAYSIKDKRNQRIDRATKEVIEEIIEKLENFSSNQEISAIIKSIKKMIENDMMAGITEKISLLSEIERVRRNWEER